MNEPLESVPTTELRRRPVTALAPAIRALGRGASATDFVVAAYDSHQRELHSFALLGTHNPAAAEDVVQEAFLRLVHEVRAGRPPENVRAWLYRVAANLIATRGRRTVVADKFRSLLVVRESANAPEHDYLLQEMSDDLHEALAHLPREARVGLLLAAHGFTGREIATAIGRSESATRSLMCRARLTMRERIQAAESTP